MDIKEIVKGLCEVKARLFDKRASLTKQIEDIDSTINHLEIIRYNEQIKKV